VDYRTLIGKSSRDAYGEVLFELALENDDVVALTADVGPSVRFDRFEKEFPNRFFDFGIAEQNLMGAAAGFARESKKPYVSVYAIFAALRSIEQIRTDIAYPNLPVRIYVSHSGISLGEAGPTHHTIEDIAVMRSIPNMTVIVPADGLSTGQLVNLMHDHDGPVYMRLSRVKEKTVYDSKIEFKFGKGQIIREPEEFTLIACGASTGNALKAVESLAERGIHIGLIDMPFIKPLDSELLQKVFSTAKKVITIEEHSIIGGLGSAVAEEISTSGSNVQLRRLGIPDEFTKAGPYEDLIRYYDLDSDGIEKTINLF
jgi:transketolase